MPNRKRSGKVQTVAGLLDPTDLGITCVREHIFHDSRDIYFHAHPGSPEMGETPVGPDNRWWIANNAFNNRDNLTFDEFGAAVVEVARFAQSGGGTLVELTNYGMGTQPEQVRKLAVQTGVPIVKGTGWYIAASHPDSMATQSVDDLAQRLIDDVQTGIADSDVPAGILGEIGMSAPVHDDEKKVLRAALVAHEETGAPISIHPGMGDEALGDILDFLENHGAIPDHVTIGHLDCFGFTREARHRVAEAGYFMAFDNFGHSTMMPTQTLGRDLYHPSDGERLADLRYFLDRGHVGQLVLSHDLYFKYDMTRHGGPGYSHIVENVIPAMLKGDFDESEVVSMTTSNPARALTFA